MSKPMMDACRPLQVPPTAKAVLMVFAYQHHDGGELWPSLTFLEESTCLSRRAVIDAIKTLEACALVSADRTQPRRTVYTIRPADFQADKIPISTRSQRRADRAPATPAGSAAGAPLVASDRNHSDAADSAAKTLPVVNLPHQQANAGSKPAAQGVVHLPHSLVHLPHSLVHLPHPSSKEQLKQEEGIDKKTEIEDFQLDGSGQQEGGTFEKKSRGKKPKDPGFDAALIELPEWLDPELWAMWCRARKAKGKPILEDGARIQLKQLDGYRREGITPQSVIEHAVASSNQGLFPPPGARKSFQRGNAHTVDFSTKDYAKDLSDGRAPD